MPQLLTLPYAVPLSAAGILLPGSKLYFYQTNTSTPQAVYTDVDLDVAHSQPVESNGAGRFPAIYLDPGLPNYRILLTDSADVTQPGYPIDDVPSQQNSAQQFRLTHTAPELIIEETDATANNGKWRIRANANGLTIDLGNDAESVWTNIIDVARSGTTLGLVTIAGVPYFDSGSFTGTLTGFAADPTPDIEYRRTGNIVTLTRNAGSVSTSDANSMTLTGMPVAIRPLQTHTVLTRIQDNGTNQVGVASVAPDGVVTFGVGGAGGVFTASGNKGLPGGWSLKYELG
jgi:hypothetical protein